MLNEGNHATVLSLVLPLDNGETTLTSLLTGFPLAAKQGALGNVQGDT